MQDNKLICTNCKKNKPTFFKSSKRFSKYCTDCFKLDHVKKQIKKEKETAVKKKDGKKKDDDKKNSDTEEEKKLKKKSSFSKTKGKGKETAAHISDCGIHSESEPVAFESDEEDLAEILSRLRRLRANGSSSSRKVGEGSSKRI
ncbi:uncharacterized protein LAESUDRAFT_757090 [Laetiporus sulphureus 93-53]|uniref:Uncharacterized protein n=1 Tax=Laetiporus sulphureus 93-53 TaxID=1314785 RepID=A0A165FFR6_9APHY|nr:uncharacterized protein LAESUDRAFT_757090 [Laetiporus sulphureus 93-53]KZT08905.1 hypothetical protein LAESUDRAFT_757090 [Laetiporus sulphureus 93-53]